MFFLGYNHSVAFWINLLCSRFGCIQEEIIFQGHSECSSRICCQGHSFYEFYQVAHIFFSHLDASFLTSWASHVMSSLTSMVPYLTCTMFCFLYLQVVDPPQGDEAGPSSEGAFGVQAGGELISESRRLWSALAETSHATATRFSRMVSLSALVLFGGLGRRMPCFFCGCCPGMFGKGTCVDVVVLAS